MPDQSEELKLFWGMWKRGWNPPPPEDPAWQVFNIVECSLPLPTYSLHPPTVADSRYAVAISKPSSTRIYDRQVIQPRWDQFWRAVNWKVSPHTKMHPPDDELLFFFDQGLSFDLRQKLRDHPDDAMAALADDDLRFAEVGRFGTDPLCVVQATLDAWLDHQETRKVTLTSISTVLERPNIEVGASGKTDDELLASKPGHWDRGIRQS
jgi:hypothetical protein